MRVIVPVERDSIDWNRYRIMNDLDENLGLAWERRNTKGNTGLAGGGFAWDLGVLNSKED